MIQHTIIDVNILLPLSIQKINTNFLSYSIGCKFIQINYKNKYLLLFFKKINWNRLLSYLLFSAAIDFHSKIIPLLEAMKMCIAEKPSVAKEIAAILRAPTGWTNCRNKFACRIKYNNAIGRFI